MRLRGYHILFALLISLSASLPFLLPGSLMIQQAVAMHEMMEKLEHEELQEITVLHSSVHWLEYNKECIINNRMFDVKDMKTRGDSVVLTGLYDDQEKEILAWLVSCSSPLQQDQDQTNIIYRITHLVLDCPETGSAGIEITVKKKFPLVPSCPLSVQHTIPPYSPPELT